VCYILVCYILVGYILVGYILVGYILAHTEPLNYSRGYLSTFSSLNISVIYVWHFPAQNIRWGGLTLWMCSASLLSSPEYLPDICFLLISHKWPQF
jgi:hypothetical protein